MVRRTPPGRRQAPAPAAWASKCLSAQAAGWSCPVTLARTGPQAPAATRMSSRSWPSPARSSSAPSASVSVSRGCGGDGWRHDRRRRHLRGTRAPGMWLGLVLVMRRAREPCEDRDRVGALLDAVRRTAADGKATGDRRRDRAGPHADQRCRVDRAVVGRTWPARAHAPPLRQPAAAVPRAGTRAGRDATISPPTCRTRSAMCVCPSTAGGIGTSAATRVAPQIQALIHRAAARARGEVKLCSPRLAPGR